jgi:hypothetical protein
MLPACATEVSMAGKTGTCTEDDLLDQIITLPDP